MKAARDDALNLIRHWYSEDTPLRCTSTTEGLGFGLTGRVAELSDSVLSIRGTACEAVITLDGASYAYHRAENIPAAIQESSSDTFVSALELTLRNGDTVIMAEVRTASSPGEQPH
jgi:hypothetical protein